MMWNAFTYIIKIKSIVHLNCIHVLFAGLNNKKKIIIVYEEKKHT